MGSESVVDCSPLRPTEAASRLEFPGITPSAFLGMAMGNFIGKFQCTNYTNARSAEGVIYNIMRTQGNSNCTYFVIDESFLCSRNIILLFLSPQLGIYGGRIILLPCLR